MTSKTKLRKQLEMSLESFDQVKIERYTLKIEGSTQVCRPSMGQYNVMERLYRLMDLLQ